MYFSLMVFFLTSFSSFFVLVVLIDFLDLWLVLVLFVFVSLFLLLVFLLDLLFGLLVDDLTIALLLAEQLDGVADELRVLLDDLFDLFLVQVLDLVLLHVQHNFGSTAQRLVVGGARADGEATSGRGLPHVLLVVVVL